MKTFLLSLLTILLPFVANADAVEIDGIYYILNSNDRTAEVTSNPHNYSGCVVIPASVTFKVAEYNVTTISSKAFYKCTGLIAITIPNSVTSIGDHTFAYCSGLTSITIPNSVTNIEEATFGGCTELSSVILSNSITSIGKSAFNGCSKLSSITIPNNVTSIEERAFFYCNSLPSVTIPNSVTSIGGSAFYACSSLTSITIPNSVTSLGIAAFANCSGLTSVVIPNSITTMEKSAFRSCKGLTTITIGSAVSIINEEAFAYCPNITDVYCLAETVPTTSIDAFQDSYCEYAALHVPINSIKAYKEKEPWKNFMSIVALEGETPEFPKCATPTISYQNGHLIFESETEGVEFVTDITDDDVKRHYDSKISLTATYTINVYATKLGYDNSDVTTATLCWIEQQPETEGIADGLAQIPSRPVLIKTDSGVITVEGVDDQTNITLFTSDGKLAGSAISQNGSASIDTHLPSGTATIVKIGEKSVKVVVR